MNYIKGVLVNILQNDEFIADKKILNCRELARKWNINYDRLYYHVVRKPKTKVV